ncbi:MAG: GntR family transcriptional regulator [Thermomicrobiales bacterium]
MAANVVPPEVLPQGNGLSRPQTRTLREWVLNQLTESILNGSMPPGYRMVESALSAELGVSRSPLREALRQLEQDGLIITLPNTSTVVAPIRRSDIDEIFEIRLGLEPFMAGYAAGNAKPSAFDICYRFNLELRKSTNGIGFARADFALHHHLWSMTNRPRITSFLQSLSRQALRQLALTAHGLSEADRRKTFDEHQYLLDAVASGDPAAATAAMQDHLNAGRSRILAVLEQDMT